MLQGEQRAFCGQGRTACVFEFYQTGQARTLARGGGFERCAVAIGRRELHRAGFTSISVYTGAFPAPRRVLKKSAAGPVGPFNRASASAWARLATDRVASTTLTFVARKDDSMTRDDFIDTLL